MARSQRHSRSLNDKFIYCLEHFVERGFWNYNGRLENKYVLQNDLKWREVRDIRAALMTNSSITKNTL